MWYELLGRGRTSERAAHLTDLRPWGSHGLAGNAPQGTQEKCPPGQLHAEHLSFCTAFQGVRALLRPAWSQGEHPPRHWRHFPHASEIPPRSARGLCLKDKPKQRREQAGRWALPQCSANFHCPKTGVQPLFRTARFSCRTNLWSIKPLNVFLPCLCLWAFRAPQQILLNQSLLPMEQENFSDCEPLRQKKLNDVSSPPTYKRTTLLRIKQAYSIKKRNSYGRVWLK